MVKNLVTFTRPKIIPPGKPKFSVINPDEIDYPINQFKSFVGPKSWLLFILLIVDAEMLDWMEVPVIDWANMRS